MQSGSPVSFGAGLLAAHISVAGPYLGACELSYESLKAYGGLQKDPDAASLCVGGLLPVLVAATGSPHGQSKILKTHGQAQRRVRLVRPVKPTNARNTVRAALCNGRDDLSAWSAGDWPCSSSLG